jgi:hemin uptake protein HemP
MQMKITCIYDYSTIHPQLRIILKTLDAAQGVLRCLRGRGYGAMTEPRLISRSAENPAAARPPADLLRRVQLASILGRDREVVIEFNGADYRLRITRNQKLILTK